MSVEESPAQKVVENAEIQAVKVAISDQWKKLQVSCVTNSCLVVCLCVDIKQTDTNK